MSLQASPSISKSSWTFNHWTRPFGSRALSRSASATVCSSLSTSLSLSTAAEIKEVRRPPLYLLVS